MSDIAIVQVTCPDRETAESIAQTLLAERLIACANILDCRSVYRWQGEIERGDEVAMQLKTLPARVAAVTARIAALHPYDLAAIEHWPAATTPAVSTLIAQAVS